MSDKSVKPVFVLFGHDGFLLDAARQEVLARIIGDSDPQVSVSSFDADAELATVLDELRTMPFLADRRAVIVRDADAFISAYRESLEKYLESPSKCSSLVLLVGSWKSNTRLYKLVAQAGEAIDCTSPNEQSLPSWLTKAAARRGKKIKTDAAALLAAWIGSDLAALDSEMEKLSLYAADRDTITGEDVSRLVAASGGRDPFALTNAITAGDAAWALKALGDMLTQRGDEFKALGLINWHLHRVLSAQQKLQAGAAPNKAIPFMPFAQQKPFLDMLHRRSLDKLQQDFRRLIAVDLAMKSGAKSDAALTDLVVQLCI